MGASASISDTNETGNRILKNTRRSFHGGVEARFIDMSLIEACSNSLESYAPASVASPADSKKFLDKMQESNNATLSKEKVVEVVKWMMRNVDNEVCMERILNFFENCAEDEMTYEEFSNLYEEISTRTELQVFFEEAFNNLDVERTGRLHKNEIVKLTGIVLSQFASLWCTKREMAEMRKKLAQQFVRVDIMVQIIFFMPPYTVQIFTLLNVNPVPGKGGALRSL